MAEAKKPAAKKAEVINEYGQTQAEYDASHSPDPEPSKADRPDTPSGVGLQAAEGLEGPEAAAAYEEAKRKARWG